MADHTKTVAQQQTHYEGNVGRVYVNPNFNKPFKYNQSSPTNGSLMHINPKFSHLIPNVQHNRLANKSKIYVNPNFIRPDYFVENPCTDSISVTKELYKNDHYQTTTNKEIVVDTAIKSRYNLVRHNENTPPIKKTGSETLSNTVKLGKYKSVRVKDIKRTLETENKSLKKPKTLQTNTLQQSSKYTITNLSRNRFKFINDMTATTSSRSIRNEHTTKKQLARVPINVFNKSYQKNIKIIKGKFMKNNIPCPLFKKFGRCLRNVKGTCEFLHDKKHVSICRKFLKGICHDQDCPLSHELTAKKMPTCYFYLNRNCNKEQCPYLHVKLNEKTKVCPKFLEGYCENGKKCLNKHMNIRPEVIRKGGPLKRLSEDGKKIKNQQSRRNMDVDVHQIGGQRNNNIECRYYQDTVNDATNSNIYDIIKPVRCKLGALPSYIQF